MKKRHPTKHKAAYFKRPPMKKRHPIKHKVATPKSNHSKLQLLEGDITTKSHEGDNIAKSHEIAIARRRYYNEIA
jgi:hypothetical protein